MSQIYSSWRLARCREALQAPDSTKEWAALPRALRHLQPRRRRRAQDAMKGMHRPASQMPPELELPRAGAWAFVLCLCGEWTIVIVPLFSQL